MKKTHEIAASLYNLSDEDAATLEKTMDVPAGSLRFHPNTPQQDCLMKHQGECGTCSLTGIFTEC